MHQKHQSAVPRIRSSRISEGRRRRPRRRGAAGRFRRVRRKTPVELTFWAWCPGSARDVRRSSWRSTPTSRSSTRTSGRARRTTSSSATRSRRAPACPTSRRWSSTRSRASGRCNALEDMGTAGANDVKDALRRLDLEVGLGRRHRSTAFRGTRARWACSTARTSSRASGLEVPETWDAYAEAALKLAKDKPGHVHDRLRAPAMPAGSRRCSGRRAGGRSTSTAPTSPSRSTTRSPRTGPTTGRS